MSISSNSWQSLLLGIGDKCPKHGGSGDHKEEINKCYDALLLQLRNPHIVNEIVRCAEHLPRKIPYYGVLVGLLNLENADFAKRVVDATLSRFKESLNSEDCNTIRVLLRFLTVLMCSHVVQPRSLVEIFDTLLSFATATFKEVTGNPFWQSRADFYVICILSSLPWGGAELNKEVPREFKRFRDRVQDYIRIRGRSQDVGLTVFESEEEKVLASEGFLGDLWNCILVLCREGWEAKSVPRHHLLFESKLVNGSLHALSAVECPKLSEYSLEEEKHEAMLKYPHRLRRLNIFSCTGAAEMRQIDPFIVEEYVLDVLLSFNGCKDSCEECPMVGLPEPFRNEYLMAETIFSQLLLLPRSPLTPSYYTLVIAHLCKALPETFPTVVEGAVQKLFDKIADMDMECRRRLILVFSHHLLNVQYIWPWGEWGYVKNLPKWAPQRVFIQEVLKRGVRLSCWERIKQSIEKAPGLEVLLPPNSGPNFNTSIENIDEEKAHELTTKFCSMVWGGNNTVPQLIAWINESFITNRGTCDDAAAIRIIISALLGISSMSFTYLRTVLRQYGEVIRVLCEDGWCQFLLMDNVSLYWRNNTQMIVTTIKQMMDCKLISSLQIVAWIFTPFNINQLHLSDHLWEVLRNTINKTYNCITDLRSKLQSLQKSVLSAEAATMKAQKEAESAESKVEAVHGQPVQAEHSERLKQLKESAMKAKDEEISLKKSREETAALHDLASKESRELFLALYEMFRDVLEEKLRPVFADTEGSSAMEIDNENEESSSQMNDERTGNNGYKKEEQEQWFLTTLGYVKAFSRQYAIEISFYMGILDDDVFRKDVDPWFKKAACIDLCKKS